MSTDAIGLSRMSRHILRLIFHDVCDSFGAITVSARLVTFRFSADKPDRRPPQGTQLAAVADSWCLEWKGVWGNAWLPCWAGEGEGGGREG